jgi:SAM-dependent methyltransferase
MFNLVASFYPLLEQTVFGSTLSRARSFFISRVTEGNSILLIGEGNGRFLFEMMKQTSSGSITVVDSSARMLAAAARRLASVDRCSRVEFIHADILEWPGKNIRVSSGIDRLSRITIVSSPIFFLISLHPVPSAGSLKRFPAWLRKIPCGSMLILHRKIKAFGRNF